MSKTTLLLITAFLAATAFLPAAAQAQTTAPSVPPKPSPGLPFENTSGGAVSSRRPGLMIQEALFPQREITQTPEEKNAPRDPKTRKRSVQILLAIIDGFQTAVEQALAKLLAGLNLGTGDLSGLTDLLGQLGQSKSQSSGSGG